ncbi:MAG: hypothetical protein IKO42_03270 [Opitutales bacterium]|nr:hypothetical protein [Opitutales bacterium]
MKILSPADCYQALARPEFCGGGNSFFDEIKDAELYASGRSALRAAAPAMQKFGAKRIWLPQWICPSLPIFFGEFFEVKTYKADLFFASAPQIKAAGGDAVLLLDFFGASSAQNIESWIEKNPQVFSILDATFAPFSSLAKNSKASCVFASLRKLLPIPDGAYLKIRGASPRKVATTPAASTCEFAADLLAAMALKSAAQKSENFGDGAYRKLFMRGEEKLFLSKTVARISPYSFEMLQILNVKKILLSRAKEIREFESSPERKFLKNCKTILPREKSCAFAPALIIEKEADFKAARELFSSAHSRPASYWNKPDFSF